LDPASTQDNIRAGTLYLRQLLNDTGGNDRMAIAAYYQGLASVQRQGLLPETERYVENVEALRSRFGGHVSAERGVLSGQGIEALHAALGGDPARTAPEITREGVAGTDPVCREAMAMFCAILGGLAGNLALTYGARGGVFIGGGICPRFPEFLAASAFRARFEAKGRFADWLRPVPAWLVLRPDAAMLGLATLARHG
jgi:glucokinase